MKQHVNPKWILLDSQSTADIFANGSLLTNIHVSDHSLEIHSNGETNITNLKGTLLGYSTVWYGPSGIANVLSLARVRKKYRVTCDSSRGNQFVVTKEDGSKRTFKQSDTGLYYISVGGDEDDNNKERTREKKM